MPVGRVSVTGNIDRKILEETGRKAFFDGGFPEAEQSLLRSVCRRSSSRCWYLWQPLLSPGSGCCVSSHPGQGTGKPGGADAFVSLCCDGGPSAGVLVPP